MSHGATYHWHEEQTFGHSSGGTQGLPDLFRRMCTMGVPCDPSGGSESISGVQPYSPQSPRMASQSHGQYLDPKSGRMCVRKVEPVGSGANEKRSMGTVAQFGTDGTASNLPAKPQHQAARDVEVGYIFMALCNFF